MDLLAACRVFVCVGERASFTLGAAAANVPQSVASRRIAALEKHLGAHLFDRSTRRAALTPFGQDLLPAAKHLVELADALEHRAEQAKLHPLSLAVPETCPTRALAHLHAAARESGTVLDYRPAPPARRADLLNSREVRAALTAVPPDDATWRVPLGLATAKPTGAGPIRIDTLRPSRTTDTYRRIWLQPEDDVPHIRDRLAQLGHRAALLPAQIAVATSLPAAVSEVMRSADLLLCSAAQATELELHFRPLAGKLARGFTVSATIGDDATRIRDLWQPVADSLGVPTEGGRHDR